MIFVKQFCQKTVVKINKRQKKELLIRPPLGGWGAEKREKTKDTRPKTKENPPASAGGKGWVIQDKRQKTKQINFKRYER